MKIVTHTHTPSQTHAQTHTRKHIYIHIYNECNIKSLDFSCKRDYNDIDASI